MTPPMNDLINTTLCMQVQKFAREIDKATVLALYCDPQRSKWARLRLRWALRFKMLRERIGFWIAGTEPEDW